MPVRNRTLRHLRRILSASTLGGAAMAMSCHSVVCDPMPRSITCSDPLDPEEVSDFSYVDAFWVSTKDEMGVQVILGFRDLQLTGDPTTSAPAVIREITREDYEVHFFIVPEKSLTSVNVDIPVTCDGISSIVTLTLDLSYREDGFEVGCSFST